MGRIVYGEDERVAKWARERIEGGDSWNGAYRAIGREVDGRLVGGVVYTDCSLTNINMHVAGEGNWLTREFLGVVFAYPFLQLKVQRVTAAVFDNNEACIRFIVKLGFVPEARLERMRPGGDVILFRMFAEDCKWVSLPQRQPR